MENLRIVVNGTLDCGKEKLDRIDISSDTAKIIITRQAEGYVMTGAQDTQITIIRAGGILQKYQKR